MRRISTPFFGPALAGLLVFAPLAGGAFLRAEVGEVIENVELPALSGGKIPLLGKATVNVFVFFKPGQEHSRTTLTQLVECEKAFAGQSVRWVAVASDRFKPAEIEMEVKATGLAMPVLIDVGDELYGRLGVALCPNIGIADRDHRLVADLPFNKVNYATILRGHIRHQLKEISDAELEQILNPPPTTPGGDASVARRRLKYAEILLQSGQHEKALANVRLALEKDPKLAEAHALRGQILAAQGHREEALKAFDEALKLDPANETARHGKKTLTEKPDQP